MKSRNHASAEATSNLTPHGDPLVSVVIVNYNGLNVIRECVSSVLSCEYPAIEVLVVDNCSTDGSINVVKSDFESDPRVKIIENKANIGFALANNQGCRLSSGDIVFLLNDDTRVEPTAIRKLVNVIMSDSVVSAVQPKLLLMNTNPTLLDSAGDMMDRFGNAFRRGYRQLDQGQFDSNVQIFSARGAAMMMRKDRFVQAGMFDDDFFMYLEDTDLGWRLRLAGGSILFVPSAVVFHAAGGSEKRIGQSEVLFHVMKNRVAMIVKNFSYANLVVALAGQLLIFFGVLLYHSIAARPKLTMAVLRGLTWNLRHLKNTLSKRLLVQRYVRRVSDEEIMKYTHHPSLILTAVHVFFKALLRRASFETITLLRSGP